VIATISFRREPGDIQQSRAAFNQEIDQGEEGPRQRGRKLLASELSQDALAEGIQKARYEETPLR
jgi:hypothetical protein